MQVPTFQISRADLYVMNLVAVDMGKDDFGELSPPEALESLSSCLFKSGPDNGIEFQQNAIGLHRQVIAEGHIGNEATQPDAVMTFLGAMVTKRFVVEIVRDQTVWDKIKRRHKILYSHVFGEPLPLPRKAQ